MAKKTKSSLIGAVGDRLDLYLEQLAKKYHQTKIYDETGKTLDLPKLIPPEDLERILQTSKSYNNFGQSMFEKFFDLSMGRASRYKEYEQIINRIPEAAQAINIYVDSILAPNIGDSDNQIVYTLIKHSDNAKRAKYLIHTILERTNFFQVLPQIIYTSLVYGDCFVELEPTRSGVRYIVHPPQKCSLVYDEKTDIELGLIIQTDNNKSKLVDMLSYTYPQISLQVPNKTISIISNVAYLSDKRNKFEVANIQNQITELISDILKNEGTNFKYLAPHRYVRFPIYYNNQYYPYGTSILDPVRSIAKQLLLIESALSIYRATRTPIRNKWTLEVGSIPPDQIPRIMNAVEAKFRRQRVLNTDSIGETTIDSIPEFMGVEEDIWTSSIDGVENLKVEQLPTADIQPFTNDADYFRKKLLSALGIPPSYLAEESGGSTRALLTLEDIRFSRTIRKLQTDINNSLQDLINTCFLLINMPQFIDSIDIALPDPSTIETNLKVENINARLNTASSFMDTFPNIPKMWVMKNLMGFNDDDLDEMKSAINDQKENELFAEQTPGKMGIEDDGSGGMSGLGDGLGGSFDNDIGDLGMDNEDNNDSGSLSGPMGDINLDDLGSSGEENPSEILNDEVNEVNNVQ